MDSKYLIVGLVLLAAVGGVILFSQPQNLTGALVAKDVSSGKTISSVVIEDTVEVAVTEKESPVLYFYSDGCHFCQLQKPILDELATEGFKVKKMDVAAHPDYWQQYFVQGTPTFIANNGNGERLVGMQQKDVLAAWLERNGAKIG
ncbi:thioredoxin family protein [Candidatus Micrarchaeota archaeon]|nr:thioredoxin family protein [Candidatus Micrarchaeota archaeon]